MPEEIVIRSALTDLSQKNANYYTVQLVGLSQQEQARLFVEQHQLQDSRVQFMKYNVKASPFLLL